MLEPPAAKVATISIFAALFSAAPFGVSMANIAIGMGFAVVGVLGRGMVDMQKALEKGAIVKLSTTLGWMGAGFVGSPFITILYLAILQGIHYPVDAFTAIVLMLLGYAGPRGVSDLISFVRGLIPIKIGPPSGGTNGG